MNLVKEVIEWERHHGAANPSFVAKGKVDDGGEYTLVVAFSPDHAHWTVFVALSGSQIHMSEQHEQREARQDAEAALWRAMKIRS